MAHLELRPTANRFETPLHNRDFSPSALLALVTTRQAEVAVSAVTPGLNPVSSS